MAIVNILSMSDPPALRPILQAAQALPNYVSTGRANLASPPSAIESDSVRLDFFVDGVCGGLYILPGAADGVTGGSCQADGRGEKRK